MKNRWMAAALSGLIAVLLMSLGAVAILAQEDTLPEEPTTPALPSGQGRFDGHDRFHGRGGADEEALADALGITVEELQAARQKIAADRLAQAVEAGRITKDQANTMLAMQALKGYLDHQTILAQALGVDAEAFAAAREAGTLRDLLAEITPADLQENMRKAVEEAVQQAVKDNVITEEQAALVLEQVESGQGARGRFGGHQGFDGRRGPHDFHGFRGAPQGGNGEAFTPFSRTSRFDA